MNRFDRIRQYHLKMISRYGEDSSLALGWAMPADQLIRFEILAGIGNLNDKTVLDAGCGYGDLYPFLKARYPGLKHYYGIEQLPELANRAKLNFSDRPDVTISCANFLSHIPQADFIIASGSLNYVSRKKDFIFKTIRKLYEHCQIGLGFNLLHTISGQGMIATYDPELILEFAADLGGRVHFDNTYDKQDYSIFIYR